MNKLTSILTTFAVVVLGLSDCFSPYEIARSNPTPNTDTLAASTMKLKQDLSQTESDLAKLEALTHAKR